MPRSPLAPSTVLVLALALGAAVASAPAARAQPTPGDPALVDLRLEALGGASVKVPATWKEVKKEPALVVREQAPDPAAQVPFLVLMCTLEEGPAASDGAPPGIPWIKVRDNIVEAASKNGRKLTLDVGDAFADVAGFEGRRLRGELESAPAAGAPAGTPPKKVAIELVALVKNQRLLTIGLLADGAGAARARELVATIAKTARLGP